MYNVSLHKWAVAKFFFRVSADNFNEALRVLREDMEKLSGEKVNLKIAFYKAAQDSGAPEQENTQPGKLIGRLESSKEVSRRLWRRADFVEAHFTTAANDRIPALKVVVKAKWPDDREINFHAEPPQQGDILGRRFLNENPEFMFWGRSIK